MASGVPSVEQRMPPGRSISTGSVEIDRRMGGGIPYGTLMLVEGQAASGRSTVIEQLLWGSLTAGEDAVLYTTEQTVQSLLPQMSGIGLDVRDYFLLDHLQIFPVSISPGSINPGILFQELSSHMARQRTSRILIVDSLTTIVSRAGGDQIQDFFARCKSLCDQGKVVICTVHTGAFDENVLTRVRSVCDAYLRLKVESSGSKLVKTLEVAKIRGAELSTGNISGFEVEPGMGIRVIPISRARA